LITSKSYIDIKGFIVEEVIKNAEQYIVEYSTLKLKNKIGSGHFSTVFRGEWRGREVAIKKVTNDMTSPGAEKEFKREIMTSVKIRHHPHLVTLIGVSQYQNEFYIISEYCHGASLFDLLHESKVLLPWSTRLNIAKQIANGMVFLHSSVPPVIHRDLKSLKYLPLTQCSSCQCILGQAP
jgi:serine/threonine protein kinase